MFFPPYYYLQLQFNSKHKLKMDQSLLKEPNLRPLYYSLKRLFHHIEETYKHQRG